MVFLLGSGGMGQTEGETNLVRAANAAGANIARVAATALTTAGHEGKAYDLSGPQALTYAEAAAILTRVLGKKVTYVAVSDAAAKAGMISGGIPEFYAEYLIDLNQVYRKGIGAPVTTAVKDVTGRAPGAFEQFVAQHAAAF